MNKKAYCNYSAVRQLQNSGNISRIRLISSDISQMLYSLAVGVAGASEELAPGIMAALRRPQHHRLSALRAGRKISLRCLTGAMLKALCRELFAIAATFSEFCHRPPPKFSIGRISLIRPMNIIEYAKAFIILNRQ